MNCTVKSLYLCVRDMERAIRFYEAFLEQPVTEKMNFTVFLTSRASGSAFLLMKKQEKSTYLEATVCQAWRWIPLTS